MTFCVCLPVIFSPSVQGNPSIKTPGIHMAKTDCELCWKQLSNFMTGQTSVHVRTYVQRMINILSRANSLLGLGRSKSHSRFFFFSFFFCQICSSLWVKQHHLNSWILIFSVSFLHFGDRSSHIHLSSSPL